MFADARPRSGVTPDRVTRIETNVVPTGAASHPQSRLLIDFWERHRRNGRLLSRAELPCREAAPLLPSLFVLEPADPAREDWRLRVVGTTLTRWLDFDPTGMTISEFYHPDHVAHNAGVYRMVTSEKQPHVTQGRLCGINRDFLRLEIVHLPMEGATPDEILLLGSISIFGE
ncbi:PAS domain-containing protein [Parvibaculum sp.]|uniref:PAS domain-containing protein n=1 Tax=Parvibaculum sp. TaxID=2024848 RepID=UPI002FDB0175